MTVEWGLVGRVVWDSCIDNNVLPLSILKELENGETMLDTVVDNEVLEKLWVCALNQESTEEPEVIKDTLLHVSWLH